MIEAGLIVARFLHYVAVTTLAGASFFPLYAHPHGLGRQPIALARRIQTMLFVAANLALVSGILWFVFAVANMSGTLDGALDRETLSMVMGDTSFGNVCVARLVLSIATDGRGKLTPHQTRNYLANLAKADGAAAAADQRPIEVYMVAGMFEHGQAEAQASVFRVSGRRPGLSLPIDELFAQVLEASPL
jgi:hypothetical protein